MNYIISNRKMNIYSIEFLSVNVFGVELMGNPHSSYFNLEGVTLVTTFFLSLFLQGQSSDNL